MVEAVTEFERKVQPWLDLDTGDDPIRIEATYNPDRPHDTPHIFNMKYAYALQQRISAEQQVGAGLSDPLAPLIEAHQARPARSRSTLTDLDRPRKMRPAKLRLSLAFGPRCGVFGPSPRSYPGAQKTNRTGRP